MLSSRRSMSPCSKNSLATKSATFHWTSHGFVMAATSQAVIIMPRKSSRWLSCHQSYVRDETNWKKAPRFLFEKIWYPLIIDPPLLVVRPPPTNELPYLGCRVFSARDKRKAQNSHLLPLESPLVRRAHTRQNHKRASTQTEKGGNSWTARSAWLISKTLVCHCHMVAWLLRKGIQLGLRDHLYIYTHLLGISRHVDSVAQSSKLTYPALNLTVFRILKSGPIRLWGEEERRTPLTLVQDARQLRIGTQFMLKLWWEAHPPEINSEIGR